MRPIDADELEKYIRDIIPGTIYSAYGEGVSEALRHLLAHIQATKEVETEPVRHEKWEDLGENLGMRCTGCKRRIRYKNGMRNSATKGYYEHCHGNSAKGYYEYCPGCGAKMGGGDAS